MSLIRETYYGLAETLRIVRGSVVGRQKEGPRGMMMEEFSKAKDRMFWTATLSFLAVLVGLPMIWSLFDFETMVAVGLIAILIQTLHNGYLINMSSLQRGLADHNLYNGLRSRLDEQNQKLDQLDGMVSSLSNQLRQRNDY